MAELHFEVHKDKTFREAEDQAYEVRSYNAIPLLSHHSLVYSYNVESVIMENTREFQVLYIMTDGKCLKISGIIK